MISNFVRVALRNFQRRKFYFFLNLLGLSIGFAAFITLYLYTAYEQSYDHFYSDSERIVRLINIRINQDGSVRESVFAPFAAGPDIAAAFPEVETQVRMVKAVSLIRYNDRWTKTEKAVYASEDFFKIFSTPLLKGNDSLVIANINTMAMSESFACRVFGEEDPIGKIVNYKGRLMYEVTGVFKDFQENSHMHFDLVLSFKNYEAFTRKDVFEEPWRWDIPLTYLKLKPDVNLKAFEQKLPLLIEERTGEYLRQVGQQFRLELQPLTAIHLTSKLEGDWEENGDGNLVLYLRSIALAVLLLAWINYISLSSAKALERVREVGVRKVLGSTRTQLIAQFLGESLLLHFIAILLAVVLMAGMKHYWPEYIRGIEVLTTLGTSQWLALFTILIFGSILSGLYPAFILSGFDPTLALKGSFSFSTMGSSLRKLLVVTQFSISLILAIWITVVGKQVQSIREKPLGFEVASRLVIHDSEVYDSLYDRNVEIFKRELARIGGVKGVSYISLLPGDNGLAYSSNVRTLHATAESAITLEFVVIDENVDVVYGLKSLAGSGLKENSKKWKEIILNRSAAKAVGFENPEDAIDERILFFNDTAKVVRVVEDFHFYSPREPIKPLALLFVPDRGYYFTLDVEPNKVQEVTASAEKLFQSIFPGQPFTTRLLEDHVNTQYKSELLFEKALFFFSTLSVWITCLGLVGMAAYMTQSRKKEIGIRKTLGATSVEVLLLLWKDHFIVVLISSFIAMPIAWYMASQWLLDFATRIHLSVMFFLVPVVVLLLVTLLAVSFQTVRAALSNPVDSIRYE
jgi:putative ABC transport system permease protein